jgi:hypothetical protein
MEQKYTIETYKTYVDVENALYKLANSFTESVKHVTPEGYNFFDFPSKDVYVRDARAYNKKKVMIILENICSNTQQQIIVVDAEEFLDSPLECAKKWVEHEKKVEDQRRSYDAERAKDLADYERIKRKYNL